MRARRVFLLSLATLLAASIFCLLCLDFLPRSSVGVVTFRGLYLVAPLRPLLLSSYSQTLRQHGGYLPAAVDGLLSVRLQCAPAREFSLVLSFYLAQSSGRLGDQLGRLPEQTKVAMIGWIIDGLDRFDPVTKLRAIKLVEYLRLDGAIHKPHLLGEPDPAIVAQAAQLYTRWWRLESSWPAKKRLSPLAESNFSISGL